mgnify:CR=1 FL=1
MRVQEILPRDLFRGVTVFVTGGGGINVAICGRSEHSERGARFARLPEAAHAHPSRIPG